MTQPPDDAALVARLRALTGTVHSGASAALAEAATALEAKDRRIAELEAERESMGLGCDANNGGLHQAMNRDKYWFCLACGMSLRQHTYTLPHIKLKFPQAALGEEDRQMTVMREALRPFADHADFYTDCEQHPHGCPDSALVGEVTDLTVGNFRAARAALEPSDKGVGSAL
jgi:hypothetical protein